MEQLQNYIEHTNLKPTLTGSDVEQLIREALLHQFVGVCLPPFWVKKASRDIGNATLQLITVVGFPLGYQMSETKIQEIELAIRDGATEIDMVMNISAFKSGLPWTKIDIAKCTKLAHDHGVILKVIIETAYLSDEEILAAAKLCYDAGADFVKTSTGLAPEGAKVEHIRLLRENLPANIGIKASGGIKTLEFAQELVHAGADRIGTSQGLAIMEAFLKS